MQRLEGLLRDESRGVPRLLNPRWIGIDWLTHGWSTRLGGVSRGAQSSLNFGSAYDQPERVSANRALWRKAVGIEGWQEVYLEQVHSANVAVARAGGVLTETDAVITNTPGMALHVLVADCLPILMLCRKSRVIGAVHAGWRGTVAGIAAKTVAAMVKHFSVNPAEVEACIGPGIGSCCYLVDKPVIDRVQMLPVKWHSAVADSSRPGQYYLDLPLLNSLLLQAGGVLPENIHFSGLCTFEDACHFYSHRRDRGNTGRMIATIGLKPEDFAGFVGTGRELLVQSKGDGVEAIVSENL